MTFYSVYFGMMMEYLDWKFIDCKSCHMNSFKDHHTHTIEKQPAFKLCDKCSEEIDKLKVEGVKS